MASSSPTKSPTSGGGRTFEKLKEKMKSKSMRAFEKVSPGGYFSRSASFAVKKVELVNDADRQLLETNGIHLEHYIGGKDNAQVWKATTAKQSNYKGHVVAVRYLKNWNPSPEALNEIIVVSTAPHKNVQASYGYYLSNHNNKDIFIVFEFLDMMSDLEAFLFNQRNPIDQATFTKFAKQIAAGLQHLHTNGLYDRHLRSAEIFITKSLEVKIPGFPLKLGQETTNNTPTNSLAGSDDSGAVKGKVQQDLRTFANILCQMTMAGEKAREFAKTDKASFNEVIGLIAEQPLKGLIELCFSGKIFSFDVIVLLLEMYDKELSRKPNDNNNNGNANANDKAEIKPENNKVVDTLTNDSDWNKRSRAARTLGESGDTSSKVIQALVSALYNDKHEMVKGNAAWSLGKIGGKSPAALQALMTTIEKETLTSVKLEAILALGWMGSNSEDVIRVLIQLFQKEIGLRDMTEHSLVQISRTSAQFSAFQVAVHYLLNDHLFQQKPQQEEETTEDHQDIDVTVIQPLTQTLRKGDILQRRASAKKLGKFRRKSQMVVDSLAEALVKDPDEYVRLSAAMSLGKLGKKQDNIMAALVYALEKDDNIEVREASAWSVLSLGESPRVVLDPLIKSAKTETDPNSRNRRLHSIHLLGELAGKDEEATEILLIIVNSETDEKIKEEAVKSLGKLAQVVQEAKASGIGTDKSFIEIIPALIHSVQWADEVHAVRIAACEALGKLACAPGAPAQDKQNIMDALKHLVAGEQNHAVKDLATKTLDKISKS